MRKLMLFTIGFTIACVLGTYFFSMWLWIVLALGLIGILVAAYLRKKWELLPVIVMITGLCIGLSWFGAYRFFYLSSAYKVDGTECAIKAEISDYGVSTDYGITAKAKIFLEGKKYPAVLYLKDDHELKPGDRVTGEFRLRMTHEGLQGDTYHRGNGIFLLAYAKDKTVQETAGTVPWRYFAAAFRRAISNTLDDLFQDGTAFFAKALILGDRSGVDYETNTAFKVSGISHIIAVSGLHVSILYSVIYQLAGRKRSIIAIIGIPILVLFAAVTGFTPSVTRACVMQILYILSDWWLKEYDPPTSLSASVLLMLMVNPVSVSSASMQLSVGCMAGILLFSEKLQNRICQFSFWKSWKSKTWKGQFRNWLASGVAVTFSSMFFTTPFVAYYFGSVSLVGVLTNLLTLWVISWIFYGIILACIVSLFWYHGAVALAGLVGCLIRYVLVVSKAFASIPLAAVYTKSGFIVAWLVLCYLIVFIFLLVKKRKPFVLVSSVIISLCVSLLLSWLLPMTAKNRIAVLDVGQGQSVLLQSHGKTYLVDCGGDNPQRAADIASEMLLSMGIFRLDGIILTHYDTDHASGIPFLLNRISADHVFVPQPTEDEDLKQSIVTSAGNTLIFVQQDIHLTWETTTLSLFAPLFEADDNESGLCILFRGENCDILITGDLGISGENKLILTKEIPPLTALIAGHHGSPYSTGESLLSVTNPQYVFISVGEGNPYGHPSQQVLDRLSQYDCTVYRTDQNGTIVFRR